jgi:hypothetical protein
VHENPLATATVAWLTSVFDPRKPAALRRWVSAHAGPIVADDDMMSALVLVVNEAVTTSGEASDSGDPVTVELWRRPDELRFLVTCGAVLPRVSPTDPPEDPRMRALWLSLQLSSEIIANVTRTGTSSRIVVTLRTGRWS